MLCLTGVAVGLLVAGLEVTNAVEPGQQQQQGAEAKLKGERNTELQ
jgi:hypothetical protein